MSNFDWTEIKQRISIDAPLQTIYNYWAIPSNIEKWFLSNAVFCNEKGKELDKNESIIAGSIYNWEWFTYDVIESGMVLTANGADEIAFTFAGECEVRVSLFEEKGYHFLELIQSKIPQDDTSKIDIRIGCAFGWSFYLVNLKSILEGGIDLRNKNEEIKKVVNS
jgi:uncharacterized protein YndB with AHSA1/START domain